MPLKKKFLTHAIIEPTQQPHSKLKQMATLAESTTILSVIDSYRHSNDKALTLRILSSLTQDFTLFFLNKHFNLDISSYLWSKANMYQRLFQAGGTSTGWDYKTVYSCRQRYSTSDLDLAFGA